MSDETRVKILLAIKKYQPISVSNIAKIIQVSNSVVSHQLSHLKNLDVIKRKRYGKRIIYAINKKSMLDKCLSNFLKGI